MKTFRILGLALVVTGLLFAGCKKTEDEDEEEEATINMEVSAPETQMNKNVLVEEFTGVNCGNCPDGHRRVNQLMAANPGKVFAINIHTGSYAAGKYTTSFGTSLAGQTHLTGYPAGTVNRHEFEGMQMDTNRTHQNRTAMGRGQFSSAANQMMAQQSCANIAAKAMINKSTRELTVNVAVYYTGTPTGSTNMLNVAIVEDSVWGAPNEQSGASSNPTQYDASTGRYCHMHMLRHLVTGQWGEEISPVQGQQIKKTYTYTLPETISNVTVVPEHLEVIVFLCEGHNEVINVCSAPITFK